MAYQQNQYFILAIIVAVVVGIALFSYQYSTFISHKIVDISLQDVRSETRIEAHDISQIFTNKIQTVGALFYKHLLMFLPYITMNTKERTLLLIIDNTLQVILLTFTCGLIKTAK